MKTGFVDFHCHLDLFKDIDSAVRDADADGIYTLSVTTTPKAWPRNYELTRHTKYVRAALGLHPQLIAERAAEISLWEEYLPQARYIGEVGLDAGSKYYRSFDLQKDIFTRILKKCAESEGKILSVHSVRCARIVLDLIESHLPSEHGTVVLHWFTGSKSDARRAVDLGCYFSINAMMMKNERGRDLVLGLPRERLLTETDAPFTQVDDRPATPVDIEATVNTLANLLSVTPEILAQSIIANLRRMLTGAGVSAEVE
jgi:TatD DNase family protein